MQHSQRGGSAGRMGLQKPRPRVGAMGCARKTHFQRVSQMFWACFGHGIRLELVVLVGDIHSARGGVTARVYRQMLEEQLPRILDHDSIFMQDNARIPTANLVQEWFNEQAIQLMVWPPYSPDSNPIENVWFTLNETVNRNHPRAAVDDWPKDSRMPSSGSHRGMG
jgi:transposase